MAFRSTSILVVLALLLLVGCATPPEQVKTTGTYVPPGTFDPGMDVSARSFGSPEELAAFAKAYEGRGGWMGGSGVGIAVRATMEAADADQTAAAPSAGSANRGFSGTNVQVEGVDEADLLKTDGEYIYTVSDGTLFIIKAYPGEEAEVVKTVDFENAPQGLFIEGDRMAVFGHFWNETYFKQHDLRPHSGMTYLSIYDISDRSAPQLVKEFKFEGYYFQARLKDGDMYLVAVSGLEARPSPMPIILESGAGGDVLRSVPVSDIAYYPLPYDNPQLATVHAVDLATFELDSKSVTVEGGHTMYMSHENIYLASTEHINEWTLRMEIMAEVLEPRLSPAEQERIRKIRAADEDVLTPSEKEGKVFQVYEEHMRFLEQEERKAVEEEIDRELKEALEQYESMEYTIIHKLAIDDGTVMVGPTGKIAGQLSSQFAMDEHDGVLRVATTLNQRWSWWLAEQEAARPAPDAPVARDADAKMIAPPMPAQESLNNVYALDSDLEVIGSLEGLAEGERIFSTRFMGDRLYMVTFRQVDPFFVIDLSDPRNIRELGELKIPGFSRYLHPYDENTIIGIGREATELGRQQGLKISLFDVSDVSRPREVAKWVSEEEQVQSQAEWEHKAFLFDREKELLVIPASSYDWERSTGQYNGAMVFRITRDDIELRGIVDHGTGSQQWYGPQTERSLYIEELLYTKSRGLLRINRISDLGSVKNITLTPSAKAPYPVY